MKRIAAMSMPGGAKTFTFTPEKTESNRFYCGKKLLFLESHREKGMQRVLEAVE